MKITLGVSALALGAALASQAAAQDSGMYDPRFDAKNVCDYIASAPGYGPFNGFTSGISSTGEMLKRGVIDLDGDGVSEFVMTPGNEMSTDISFAIKPDGTETPLTEAIENFGTGTGFLPFNGRWYLVNSSTSFGAFVMGAYSFTKGSLKPVPACTFENDVKETMSSGANGTQEDSEWCGKSGIADAAANRLKPAITLSDAQKAALMAEANVSDITRLESAGDIYKPTTGPFAGLLLWKARLTPFIACTGSAFLIVEDDGKGGYKIAAPGDKQKQLDGLLGIEDLYNNSCTPDADLFEANGKFFVERHWGGGKQTDDHQLLHTLLELRDGQPAEVCASYFEVTPKVTFMAPDQPK